LGRAHRGAALGIDHRSGVSRGIDPHAPRRGPDGCLRTLPRSPCQRGPTMMAAAC
jgi:hypothetical protein